MNSKNYIPAGILITIGVLFLADNFDWFDFDWDVIVRFWPVLIILLGVNLLIGKRSSSATALTILALCIAIPAALVSHFRDRWDDRDHYSYHWDEDDNNDHDSRDNSSDDNNDEDNNDNDSDGSDVKQSFTEPMESGVKSAAFTLEGGAAKFTIGTTSTNLAEANTDLDFGKGYTMKKVLRDGIAELNFETKNGENQKWNINDNSFNKVDVKLNPSLEWDMNFKIGAGKADFDLSAFNIKKLTLETGVTDTEIKLGDKALSSGIRVESGVAQVEFQVPQSVGCRIEVNGALNGKDFDGFTQNGDSYETPGYDKATKKITIKFDGGLSNLKVRRY